ncbi:MAG TPA: SH3 domain-containing C40 family peptidase [Terriglobales bacterium]|nr:SH3 domain-containing C40 family peptidase [Terriglobales bacterium]
MLSTRVRRAVVLLLAGLMLSIISLAAQQTSAPLFVVVKPVVNMYSGPSEDSDVVSQAIYSTNVSVIGEQGDWLNIRTPDEYTGWIQRDTVKATNGTRYASEGRVVRVAQMSANLYREPSVTKHAPVVTVPWETRLEVIEQKVEEGERWMKVRLPDGREAYVQTGDVSFDFKPLSVDDTIALAKKFIGVTYTWGGTSSWGYDCSGFMQMLIRQRGVLMPRDADDQASWSGVAPVERKDLQAGDLLYFGPRADRITHTGMYIGNGEFIHDTTNTHPVVQISKLNDLPWTKLLVAARRLKQEAEKK